jgi:hypothetical protein
MYTVIPSILNGEKIAYKVHSHFDDLWDAFRRANRPLDVHIGAYDTYGDGTTQHSNEWPANNEQFTDFCLSFARWLLNASPEEFKGTGLHSRDSIGIKAVAPDLIDFLGKIQYRDDKRQYFSRSERKLTTSEKARHDKRFLEVPSWANGSFRNVVGLYLLESNPDSSHMRWYSTVYSIAHHMNAMYNLNLSDEERGFNCAAIFPGDHQEAFRALSFAFDAVEARDNSSRVIDCALSNMKHQQEREQAAIAA